jgi:hypothetical protein
MNEVQTSMISNKATVMKSQHLRTLIQTKLASITRIIGIIDRLGCLCTICDNYKSAHSATLTSAKQPLSLLLLLLPIVLLLMFSIIINIPAVRPHCTASLWLTAAENAA